MAHFLMNKDVALVQPVIISDDPNQVRLACRVLLHKTDITYFFPELSDKKKEPGWFPKFLNTHYAFSSQKRSCILKVNTLSSRSEV